jgi:hypothetical protein
MTLHNIIVFKYVDRKNGDESFQNCLSGRESNPGPLTLKVCVLPMRHSTSIKIIFIRKYVTQF